MPKKNTRSSISQKQKDWENVYGGKTLRKTVKLINSKGTTYDTADTGYVVDSSFKDKKVQVSMWNKKQPFWVSVDHVVLLQIPDKPMAETVKARERKATKPFNAGTTTSVERWRQDSSSAKVGTTNSANVDGSTNSGSLPVQSNADGADGGSHMEFEASPTNPTKTGKKAGKKIMQRNKKKKRKQSIVKREQVKYEHEHYGHEFMKTQEEREGYNAMAFYASDSDGYASVGYASDDYEPDPDPDICRFDKNFARSLSAKSSEKYLSIFVNRELHKQAMELGEQQNQTIRLKIQLQNATSAKVTKNVKIKKEKEKNAIAQKKRKAVEQQRMKRAKKARLEAKANKTRLKMALFEENNKKKNRSATLGRTLDASLSSNSGRRMIKTPMITSKSITKKSITSNLDPIVLLTSSEDDEDDYDIEEQQKAYRRYEKIKDEL